MKNLSFILALVFSMHANAAEISCTGSVDRLLYHQPDSLYIKLSSTAVFKVCSPQAQYYRTGPESCQMIASLAMTARATSKDMIIWIDNAPGETCGSIPNWFTADVRIVELKE